MRADVLRADHEKENNRKRDCDARSHQALFIGFHKSTRYTADGCREIPIQRSSRFCQDRWLRRSPRRPLSFALRRLLFLAACLAVFR